MTSSNETTTPTTLAEKVAAAQPQISKAAFEDACQQLEARCERIGEEMFSCLLNAARRGEFEVKVNFAPKAFAAWLEERRQTQPNFFKFPASVWGEKRNAALAEELPGWEKLKEKADAMSVAISLEGSDGKEVKLSCGIYAYGKGKHGQCIGKWLYNTAKCAQRMIISERIAEMLHSLDEKVAELAENGQFGPMVIVGKDQDIQDSVEWHKSFHVEALIDMLEERNILCHDNLGLAFYLDPATKVGPYADVAAKVLQRREEIVSQRLAEIEQTLEQDLLVPDEDGNIGTAVYDFPHFWEVNRSTVAASMPPSNFYERAAQTLAKTCSSFDAFIKKMALEGMKVMLVLESSNSQTKLEIEVAEKSAVS